MRQCQQCGAEIRAEARFCALCGSEAVRTSSRRRRVSALPLIGTAALILAAGIAAVVLLRSAEDDEAGDPAVEAVAAALAEQLGSRNEAARAALRALDRGYTYPQLVDASHSGELQADGVIMDANGATVAPQFVREERRYARAPAPARDAWVAAVPPGAGPGKAAQAQESDLVGEDLAALNRMAAEFQSQPGADVYRNFGGLDLLLTLARSGYNPTEIFLVLARPGQKVVGDLRGNIYVVASPDDDGQPPARHLECPEVLSEAECGEALDATERVKNPDEAPFFFPGYKPGGTTSTAAESEPDVEPEDEKVRTYSGQLESFVCDNVAANPGITHTIEATVIGDVIELAFEATCYQTTWVQDATTRTVTCAYTLRVDASATGLVSSNGEFTGSGTSEQRASDFQGPKCEEFPYDGSNDSTEPFMISGTVSDNEISGSLYDDASSGAPGLRFSLPRQ